MYIEMTLYLCTLFDEVYKSVLYAIFHDALTLEKMTRRYWNINLKEMTEAGVHFGHGIKKWNPKMVTYISVKRKGMLGMRTEDRGDFEPKLTLDRMDPTKLRPEVRITTHLRLA
jgi:hypothetical protein